jgi:hypothetical protein
MTWFFEVDTNKSEESAAPVSEARAEPASDAALTQSPRALGA